MGQPVKRAAALALKKRGEARPLQEYIESVNTAAGQARLAATLASRPFPHFEAAPKPGLLIKIDEDGTRTFGRFFNREFKAVKP